MEKTALTAQDHTALSLYGLDAGVVEQHARHGRYAKGEWMCRAGQPIGCLLLLTAGRCKVVNMLGNGKLVLLGFYEGEELGLIGDMEFLTGTNATSDVLAVQELHCVWMPLLPQVVEYLATAARFNRRMAEGLAAKFRSASDNNVVRLLTSLEERLCGYIYLLHDGGVFDENLTEVADLLATSYRHLMRTLRALCEKGVLRGENGVYYVLDEIYLREKSGEAAHGAIEPHIG